MVHGGRRREESGGVAEFLEDGDELEGHLGVVDGLKGAGREDLLVDLELELGWLDEDYVFRLGWKIFRQNGRCSTEDKHVGEP